MARLVLEKFLPYRLVHLSQMVTKAFFVHWDGSNESTGAAFRLTIPQWRVVALLDPYEQKAGMLEVAPPNHTSTKAALNLVAVSGMDKVQVSRACDYLSKEGFLSKRVDLADRRKLKLELTPKGKRAYTKYTEFSIDWERRLIHPLTNSEKQSLGHLIKIIVESSTKGRRGRFPYEQTEGRPKELTLGEGHFDLSVSYSYQFAIMAKLISENFSEVYRDRFGLTIPEWRLIAILAQYGSITAKEASQIAGLDKVQVSRAIAKLQEAKLLVRQVNPSDRRKVELFLPPKGKRTYHNISSAALEWEKEFVSVFTLEELDTLDQIIRKITEQAKRFLEESL